MIDQERAPAPKPGHGQDRGSEPDSERDDAIYKALADPSRRSLLDRLRERDGQSLSELERRLPMTRFGVAKHLKVLEGAGLVASRKVGREKLHYLNPVPIQTIYDRWVRRFAQPWASGLTDLRRILEESPMAERPSFVYKIAIRTTPERLWQALTDGELTRRYYFASAVEGEWRPGGAYRYVGADGNTLIDGEVVEADPPRKLVTTFRPHFRGDPAPANVSRVTFEIEQRDAECWLTLVHEGMVEAEVAGFSDGWVGIFSRLKTLLEVDAAVPAGV